MPSAAPPAVAPFVQVALAALLWVAAAGFVVGVLQRWWPDRKDPSKPPAVRPLRALTAAVTAVAGASGPGYHNHWHPERLGHAVALGHFLLAERADLSAFGVAHGEVRNDAQWRRSALRLYRQFTQRSPAYAAVLQRVQAARPQGVPSQLQKYDVLAGVLIASNWAL